MNSKPNKSNGTKPAVGSHSRSILDDRPNKSPHDRAPLLAYKRRQGTLWGIFLRRWSEPTFVLGECVCVDE